ncbi:hypothetical protein ABI_42400 [Asticcacaulis biprosthecium C19]|uniref:UrcA family protein n=1 Tax=Asticcacaulis biprosthecium C19 TaxID=715226 RepID=F4QSU7_9CAUL|nr:UrcA family protein [Asticcacaulis biprosthecium]EGF89817.1 hypothetical protein ABI_42400 [Asticcacaulis biprosthecium C19]
MNRTITIIAFSAIAALTASAAVAAGGPEDQIYFGADSPLQEVVSLSGVNLSNPTEARAFYKDLKKAAARVCINEDLACERSAVKKAIRQIGSPELARLDSADAEATQMAATQGETTSR